MSLHDSIIAKMQESDAVKTEGLHRSRRIGDIDVSSKKSLAISLALSLFGKKKKEEEAEDAATRDVTRPPVTDSIKESKIAKINNILSKFPAVKTTKFKPITANIPKGPAPTTGLTGSVSPKFAPIKPPKIKAPVPSTTIQPAKGLQGGTVDWSNSIKAANESKALRKSKDLTLWNDWDKGGRRPQQLKPLMSALAPVIYSRTNIWRGQVPDAALNREAQTLALKALHTYNPGKGAALNTHVTNSLKKISRLVYSNQDIIRLPEDKKLNTQALYKSTQVLEDELGRTPSDMEIADDLGWNIKRVRQIQGLGVNELVGSLDVGGDMFGGDITAQDDRTNNTIHFVYADLQPTDQVIFEHSTGFGGKPRKTGEEIARLVNLTPSQVYHRKNAIAAKLKGVL